MSGEISLLNAHSIPAFRSSCDSLATGVKPMRPAGVPLALLRLVLLLLALLGWLAPTGSARGAEAPAANVAVSAPATASGAPAGSAPATSGGLAASGGRAASGTSAESGAPAAPTGRDPAACRTVRMSDVGWTDVTATTALFAELLREIGYEPKVTVLSVPVTFASIANGDLDVFLGNWMPMQEADRKSYIESGSLVVVRPNLLGAKYTLAVPTYTYEAGLKDFADIRKFAGPLDHSIYGIEPGNDGNRLVLGMIKQDQFGLGDFKLVESSEQGMLAQVERAFKDHQPIVFLAWEPHPMNVRFDIKYLNGGDAVFGPNFGGATIYTVTRRGYAAACPNIEHLLENLEFSLRGESEMMGALLDRHEQPQPAAAAWLKAHDATVRGWLEGVRSFDGRDAYAAMARSGPLRAAGFESWVTGHKIPVGDAMARLIDAIKAHGSWLFGGISILIHGTVDGMTRLLQWLPAPLLILALAVFAQLLRRSWPLTVFVALALLFILNQGYWAATLETLALVLVATLACALLGVPLGIGAAHHPRLYAALRPVLDLMQTLPTFVYLIPTLVLFGLGVVPGLISTVIFALPAPIRLTHLGISSVPRPLIEAGEAFGATRMQLLFKVELPSAATAIVAGITQCIMLSLSMVVIAALVGAGGLGVPVVRALNSVQVGMGFEAGFTIVLLAIILDRISRPKERGGTR
jgi:glycine betaine/proline transport system substrate-binding protein